MYMCIPPGAATPIGGGAPVVAPLTVLTDGILTDAKPPTAAFKP